MTQFSEWRYEDVENHKEPPLVTPEQENGVVAVIGHAIPGAAKQLPPTKPLSWSLLRLMKQDIARTYCSYGPICLDRSSLYSLLKHYWVYQRKWVAEYDEWLNNCCEVKYQSHSSTYVSMRWYNDMEISIDMDYVYADIRYNYFVV
jgi:hypothetical protein